MSHLLLVNERESDGKQLRLLFNDMGHRVTTVATLTTTIEQHYDLLIYDISMYQLEDVAAISLPDVPILLVTSVGVVPDWSWQNVVGILVLPVDEAVWGVQVEVALQNGRLYLQRRAYKQQLTQIEAELDKFTRTVAHDLKSPIATVVTMTEFLNLRYQEALGESGAQFVERIQHNALKAVGLLDALMHFYKLKHEQPPLTDVSMKTAVADALAQIETPPQAKIKQPERWPYVFGHLDWFTQIWHHLIENACRFGGEEVVIELGYMPVDEGMRFWVQDSGPCIPEAMRPKLFMPFERAPHHQRMAGFGLGLAIVARLSKRLGGCAGVACGEAYGNTFWFWLPA